VTAAKQGRADVLRVVCGDGSVLGVLELQPPGKKVMAARDFLNGLAFRVFFSTSKTLGGR
jgi:methionyl-tRNA formyltransferase